MKTITVVELKKLKDDQSKFQLIDIRENYEVEISHIDGEHIPMGEIMEDLNKINKDIPVIIHCRAGSRSAAVVNALMHEGFDNVHNLVGGMKAWKNEIDNSIEVG